MYLDASALVKLFLPEPESDELNRALRAHRALTVSDLAITECVSALARRRRQALLHVEAAMEIHRALLETVRTGVFACQTLSPHTHREAERLLLSLETVRLRAADVLHLALALSCRASHLITFDGRLADAARAVGLSTAFA